MNFSIDSKYTQKYNSTISDKKIPNNIEQNEIVVIEKDIINEDIVKEDDLDFFIDNDNNFLKLDLENCLSCSENIDEEYIKDNLYYSFLSNKDIDFLNENNFYDS
jgi:membrane-associated HD superfamily phosphohydrolase